MSYNYLPGIQINTVDGGLAATRTPQAHSILIIGTSAQGVINQPYPVTDRAQAALQFGLQGNLIRAMEEAAINSDNIILFRMGASAQQLTGVGVETGASPTPGFNLAFGQVTPTCATDYTIWYKAGVLAVYYLGDLVYSNDPAQATDNGDITITGVIAGNTGLQLGTGANATPANAITVQAAAALVGAAPTPAPTLVAAVSGIGLTGRQTFIAALEAFQLLQGYQCEEVVVPSATVDAPNVAFYVAASPATAANNPATNPNALDWLKTTTDQFGNQAYQWASETKDSNGTVAVAMPGTVLTGAARQAAGFYEVSWGYAIASFCAQISSLNKTCVGFIGTSGPASYKLVDVRKWIGYLPTYDANGNPLVAGGGLLGLPFVAGGNASQLNSLCADFATGYRKPGYFQTANGQQDGPVVTDKNQNPIDIGAYLHVVADQAVLATGYATNYVSNLATFVAGFCSVLDEKTALTNQKVKVKQIPGLVYTPGQLDALAEVKINVLKSKGANSNPALLHDFTCATDASDYTQLLRVRIKGLFVATLLRVGDPFVGASSLDGLQLNSLKTALDAALVEGQKRGYWSNPQVTISSTQAEQKIGHADLYGTFHPADQLVQLNAYVGLSQ